jgi:hypothetical protein
VVEAEKYLLHMQWARREDGTSFYSGPALMTVKHFLMAQLQGYAR